MISVTKSDSKNGERAKGLWHFLKVPAWNQTGFAAVGAAGSAIRLQEVITKDSSQTYYCLVLNRHTIKGGIHFKDFCGMKYKATMLLFFLFFKYWTKGYCLCCSGSETLLACNLHHIQFPNQQEQAGFKKRKIMFTNLDSFLQQKAFSSSSSEFITRLLWINIKRFP